MIITHKVKKDKISRNIFNTVERTLSLFMLNGKGHYFSLPVMPKDQLTNFNGWFNLIEYGDSYSLYKSIDNIYLSKTVTELINSFTDIERASSDTVERFTLAKNGVIYEVKNYGEYVYLDLDFRDMFDTNDQGRIYKIIKQDDTSSTGYEYVGTLDYDTNYFWRVKAIEINGLSIPSDWSAAFSFKTESAPSPQKAPQGEPPIPTWVWMVIGIGFILAAIVMLLILRTRNQI